VTALGGPPGQDERALVVGPLAMPGFLLVLIGVRRHRRAFVLAGAVLLGLAIKLVDRPRRSQEAAPAPASESEVSPAQEPPTSTKPPTPKPPTPQKPQAPSAPEAPAAETEPAASEPDPDQPETP
jgi:hypothetical protein